MRTLFLLIALLRMLKFISSFDDINYVSRGQKDCTYELKPSLYRIYSDNYKSHASDFEDRFKQKSAFL